MENLWFLHQLPDHLGAKKRCEIAQAGRGFLPLLVVHVLNSFQRKLIDEDDWQSWGHLGEADVLRLTLDTLPLQALKDPGLQEAGHFAGTNTVFSETPNTGLQTTGCSSSKAMSDPG